MIKLTFDKVCRNVWINPDQIVFFESSPTGTIIRLNYGWNVEVVETPDEVLQAILDAKEAGI